MNVNKENFSLTNGWILCPSKSFPGKFYFFNVLNGESAWSLTEADRKTLKKENTIHKIADKSHDYPEPTTLPDDTTTMEGNISSHFKKPDCFRNSTVICSQQLPMFGQAALPKYVSNIEPPMSNIMWAPVLLPMLGSENKKPMFDKVTQTAELERELFIQSCDKPLCQRFKNYENPSLSFDSQNKIVKLTNFVSSTPIKPVLEVNLGTDTTKSTPLIKERIYKFYSKLFEPKTPETINEKTTLPLCNNVESVKDDEQKKLLENLDQNDLRFLLLAKRRKSGDCTTVSAVERKKLKPSEIKNIPKKKVTFELNSESDEEIKMNDLTIDEDIIRLTLHQTRTNITDATKSSIQRLEEKSPINETPKELPTPATIKESETCDKKNIWLFVVDTDVLLLDGDLIDKIVLSDPARRLVIPHSVRSDIEALCMGDCCGQQRVISARKITRKLEKPPPHYILEPTPEDIGLTVTTESILNYCIQAAKQHYNVVLITNDPHLQIKAISCDIPSYRINQIKYGVNITPDMTSECKKIKFNFNPHEENDKNNTFIQNKSNLKLFSNLNVDSKNKQSIFVSDNKINCDMLIDVTKPKFLLNCDKVDSNYTSSDISREVQNLNLKEKNLIKTQNVNKNEKLITNIKNVAPIQNKKNIEIFKIPQPLQFENGTLNTSVQVESSTATDVRTRKLKELVSLDEDLKRFTIKSEAMSGKIKSRIDEWICTFIQIMEDVLNGILQNNNVSKKYTMAPLTLHDTLNCIKLLHDSHPKIRDAVDNLSGLLDKCVCMKGKIKTSINPDDFMTMYGYGVLLVLSLQKILPLSEELVDAESCLNQLLNNIESDSKELDPELLRTPVVSRCDDVKDDEIKPNFVKDPSFILDYLKKHYPVWECYTEKLDKPNLNKIQNKSGIKVLRTFGKALNLFKIDRNKTMFLENATEDDSANNNNKNGPKIIKLIENNQLIHPNDSVTKESMLKIAVHKTIVLSNKEQKIDMNGNDNNSQHKDALKVMKPIENLNHDDEPKSIDLLNLPLPDNTSTVNAENDGPKIIRNIKLIDEYEKKINDKEPLDMELLDYSEIDEPSIQENPEFEIFSEKNASGLMDKVNTVDDFTQDLNIENNDFFLETFNFYNNNLNNTENSAQNINLKENFDRTGCDIESDTYTEKMESRTGLDNAGTTNDSGFENDSTYAHSLVKIFFNELSSSFKVVYNFITKFLEEIQAGELCDVRKNIVHDQASKSLEYMVAIIQRLRNIIQRESADETVLKTLLLKAGVEATTDIRMTKYRQIVKKCLEQAQILENALRIIILTTLGDFDAISNNADSISSSIRFLNIFE